MASFYHKVKSYEEAQTLIEDVKRVPKERGGTILEIAPSGPFGINHGAEAIEQAIKETGIDPTDCVKAELDNPLTRSRNTA
jgi:hypothetical protein